ncbi:DUF1573 domain-containing protein [Blastopirellula marina]|uniref:DUF1573 domain-containing protein n=1 Tax=Blastopirellula marina TaxID=124 RepID=A0A2S8FFE8_9BACT|nr:DUF1573 domain-containing protein [Blastopirellula marina]PQO30867.1 hypothetical protein C5Y98_20980 [Blastopirellula marina]PTL42720.1 DUF1573 domain-containing protein [Blastopirellula marina]
MFDKIPLAVAVAVLALLGVWWVIPTDAVPATASAASSREIESSAAKSEPKSPTDSQPKTTEPEKHPKVEVDRTEFNFGTMERFESSTHTFTIRNVGDAPLQLEVGPSSCSCTLAGLEESGVQPGEETHIKLEWTLKFKEGPFRQTATILTNDPDRPEILFAVEGFTQEAVKFTPSTLVFSEIPVGSRQTRAVEIAPSAFAIGDVTLEDPSSVHPLAVTLTPPSEDQETYRLDVTVPEEMPRGHFRRSLNVLVAPQDSAKKTVRRTLIIEGNVTGGFVVMSPNMRQDGIYDVPPISEAGEQEFGAIIRVRDFEKNLKIKSITCKPDFITATLEPQSDTNVKGLYKLRMTVAADAPNGVYRGTGGGNVVIELDHPRIERIQFNLECAINR